MSEIQLFVDTHDIETISMPEFTCSEYGAILKTNWVIFDNLVSVKFPEGGRPIPSLPLDTPLVEASLIFQF